MVGENETSGLACGGPASSSTFKFQKISGPGVGIESSSNIGIQSTQSSLFVETQITQSNQSVPHQSPEMIFHKMNDTWKVMQDYKRKYIEKIEEWN